MALKHTLLGAAALLAASAGAAQAGTMHGWYLSLGAGVNFIQDGKFDFHTRTGPAPSSFTSTHLRANYDTGFAVMSAVGYDFSEHWRAEFEVAYRHNGMSVCSVSGSCTGAWRVWELSEMVNVLYDFNLNSRWSASLGAGVGGNLVSVRPGNQPSADDYVFAGQLIAQLAYQLSDRWQLYGDYHFMMMSDPSFDNPVLAGSRLDIEKTEHTVTLGLRFDLQREGAAPPPPREEPPPPPERPREFIVFFGFNKSNLTAEAQRVVHEAAEAAHEFGSATILVVGHTDTSGSQSYNLRLSLRRASAVKAGLEHEGIAADMIRTEGKGETELMVQTGDGVKEPQNRRASISLH